MNLVTVVFLAAGLAADAFAVSVANGIAMKNCYKLYYSLVFGFYFGLFQFGMPVLGFFLGRILSGVFEDISNWIAFGLLAVIGAKMIYESLKDGNDDTCGVQIDRIFAAKNMCVLALATSIDACAVGVSFAMTDTRPLPPSVIIGAVTFVFSAAGVYIGKQIGGLLNKSAGVIGGLILLVIGFKMLIT